MRPRYSIVIPIYNESETIDALFERLTATLGDLDGDAEMVFVDDCSFDGSDDLLRRLRERDERVKVIRLARNFGHQTAITAGLDLAAGDAVVVMDADLQDPPELIPALVEKWQEGYEVVYAVRSQRHGESWLKRLTAKWFYRLLKRLANVELPLDTGDFRLVDRRALAAFKSMRERRRYVRGMFSWIGFKQVGVPYERAGRFAGEPKYSMRKSLGLAADGVLSFSDAPLRLALFGGFLFSLLSFVVGVAAIVAKVAGAFVVPGWASILVVVSFIGGVQLTLMGMLGLYIGRIYDEVKGRPVYVVGESYGFANPEPLVLEPNEARTVRD